MGTDVLDDFAERQIWTQQLRAPGVVVHRSAYENVGGFCTLLRHAPDWELYFRLAQLSPFACVRIPYALYRQHSESQSSRVLETGLHIYEPYFVVRTNLARLGRSAFEVGEKAWRSKWAEKAETIAWELDREGAAPGRYDHARWAWILDPTLRRGVMLAKSWLKHKLT